MVDPIGTREAVSLLSNEQLQQLFDSSIGYLSKVDETFDVIVSKSKSSLLNSQNQNQNQNPNPNPNPNNKHSIFTTANFNLHQYHHNKKTLILDVDNTLIYVRHFMDEMRVDDHVKLGNRSAIVTRVTYQLELEFIETREMKTQYHFVSTSDDQIPERGEWFPNEKNKIALIHQSDPVACEIEIIDDNSNDENYNDRVVDEEKGVVKSCTRLEISFLRNSPELSTLQPSMKRKDYADVDFMYGGYLVRIRPYLATFLAKANNLYDVVLFTAADRTVYTGLLSHVHDILKHQVSSLETNNIPKLDHFWSQILFRDDTEEKIDEYGLLYRHKNLSKLGCDLASVVMIDDNPLSYRGYEPNAIRVAGWWGTLSSQDNELLRELWPTLEKISNHKDVRYFLSGLGDPPQGSDSENENDDNKETESTAATVR